MLVTFSVRCRKSKATTTLTHAIIGLPPFNVIIRSISLIRLILIPCFADANKISMRAFRRLYVKRSWFSLPSSSLCTHFTVLIPEIVMILLFFEDISCVSHHLQLHLLRHSLPLHHHCHCRYHLLSFWNQSLESPSSTSTGIQLHDRGDL